jgi:hypothetical protein
MLSFEPSIWIFVLRNDHRIVDAGEACLRRDVARSLSFETPPSVTVCQCLGVTRARPMMNTNGFRIGAAPGSLSPEDRVKP